MERSVTRGKCHVGNRTEHDHTTDHGNRLDPHTAVTCSATEEERTCEGATTQSDSTLQPTWAGEFCVGDEFLQCGGVGGGFDDSELAFVLQNVAREMNLSETAFLTPRVRVGS